MLYQDALEAVVPKTPEELDDGRAKATGQPGAGIEGDETGVL